MRVCVIFPKTTIFENPMVYPPLGLFWLIAVLKKQGQNVTFIDMSETITDHGGGVTIKYENPPLDFDIYLIGGTSPQAQEIIRVAKFLKDNGKFVIGGGPHITNNAGRAVSEADLISTVKLGAIKNRTQRLLLENFHILVRHEGEVAIIEALDRIDEGIRTMMDFGRGIVIEKELLTESQLGEIPLPDREYAGLYKAFLEDDSGNKYLTTTVYSSRGCPKRCAFCDSPALWGARVRRTPIERVKEELNDIYTRGFRGVYFYDEILFIDRKRAVELSNELRRLGMVFRGNVRTDIICHRNYGYEFLKLMRDNGLVDIFVGVESGSNQMKDNIHKGTTIEQDSQVLKWCKELGIKFKASVIIGLPGETRETMEATRRWVIEHRPHKVNVCLYIPFPGTPIVKQFDRRRGLAINEDHFSDVYGREVSDDNYDISWDIMPEELERMFFAGSREPGKIRAMVSTSHLTKEEMQDFYDKFIEELNTLGIPY